MRTTITLDPDVDSLLRKLMRDRRLSFKEAVNEAIRMGLMPQGHETPFRTRSFDLGVPRVSLDQALQLAAELEDEEIVRKLAVRK